MQLTLLAEGSDSILVGDDRGYILGMDKMALNIEDEELYPYESEKLKTPNKSPDWVLKLFDYEAIHARRLNSITEDYPVWIDETPIYTLDLRRVYRKPDIIVAVAFDQKTKEWWVHA
ncbi:hypothetical protein LCGC14_2379350 [marine sediment metagenome]|uniref:Uncharacterized protein n=1 Tax=marine sediment metagenome TaxID=412755 RepID=A0A0F9EW42_9ZZZZ